MTDIPDHIAKYKNTHLMGWLHDPEYHCLHGSQGWCEDYLHSAAMYIGRLVIHLRETVPPQFMPWLEFIPNAWKHYNNPDTFHPPNDFEWETVRGWIDRLERKCSAGKMHAA